MALVLIQLSLLLLSCFTVSGDTLDLVSWAQPPHHHHAPIYPPAEAPKHPKGAYPPHPHHHKNHPPVHPPMHPPLHPPPSHPPQSHPPVHPPPRYPPRKRSFIAVQGVVFCKSCKYSGVESLWGALPLPGAVVKLQCNNTRHPKVEQATTDKNGYFYMAPKWITTYAVRKCKVSLVSSPPMAKCSKPTNLGGGELGATLKPEKQSPPFPHLPTFRELFSVGPFAFEPSVKC